MNEEVLYFGYGANRSINMMEAITGKRLQGSEANLEGYELCVQHWEEIPDGVRRVLHKCGWDSTFRNYCIRQATGGTVSGKIWYITRQDRDLISEWEMCGLWYEPIIVEVSHTTGLLDIETEAINDPWLMPVAAGRHYPTFLNPREKMFTVATSVREQYMQRMRTTAE